MKEHINQVKENAATSMVLENAWVLQVGAVCLKGEEKKVGKDSPFNPKKEIK